MESIHYIIWQGFFLKVVAQFDLCTVAFVLVCFFVNQNVAFGAETHHKTV